jgi:hypothetical protein
MKMMSEPLVLQSQLRRLDLLLVVLIKLYLLADFANGYLLYQFGNSYGLSAAYKSFLLLGMALAIGQTMGRTLALMPALLLALLIGPAVSYWALGNRVGFASDIGMMLKLVAPLIALWYAHGLCQRDPLLAKTTVHQLMWFSFGLVVFNLLLGRLGYGLSAYLPSDYFPNQQLGSKGFFKATNELSALLLVFSAYLLSYYWPRRKAVFALVAALALFCSSTLLTKTGNAGVLLLIVLIPLLQARASWLPQRRLLLAIFAAGALLSILLLLNLPALLSWLPLSQKLQMVLQQQGILGLLLSNRDLFVAENWFFVERHFPLWQQLFGVGNTGLALYSSKPLSEIDPADLFIWFGLAGVGFFLLWFAYIIGQARRCWQQQAVGVASGLLLLNLLLLLVSALAGHVLTSGMLWIPWGLLNGCIWLWCRPEHAHAA